MNTISLNFFHRKKNSQADSLTLTMWGCFYIKLSTERNRRNNLDGILVLTAERKSRNNLGGILVVTADHNRRNNLGGILVVTSYL